MDRDELKPCPMCGSGPAIQPGRFTSASFSGVEVMDAINKPYVWCGTCCLQTRTCDSVAEAIDAWNTRLQPSGDGGLSYAKAIEDGMKRIVEIFDSQTISQRDGLAEIEKIARAIRALAGKDAEA